LASVIARVTSRGIIPHPQRRRHQQQQQRRTVYNWQAMPGQVAPTADYRGKPDRKLESTPRTRQTAVSVIVRRYTYITLFRLDPDVIHSTVGRIGVARDSRATFDSSYFIRYPSPKMLKCLNVDSNICCCCCHRDCLTTSS